MFDMPLAINHIAITMPNREAWLKQLAFLRQKGVKFQRRVNHGMTHSLYISDPNGYGIEVLYELPREVWGDNIQVALDCADRQSTRLNSSHTCISYAAFCFKKTTTTPA